MLTIGSSSGGIGDNLIYTPIFNAIPTIFEIKDHPKSRNVTKLFEDLCDIKFVENPVGCPQDTSKSTNIIQKKLDALGLDVSPIPKINILEQEIEWANNFLKNYKNPIVFVTDTNGSYNSSFEGRYRIPNDELLQSYVDELNKNYTVLQFSLSNNIKANWENNKSNILSNKIYQGCVPIFDLGIRELAACYSIIKKYFGVDTGDYWLMIAVGGQVQVLCPDSTPFYSHDEWHLKPEFWWAEESRIKYVDFNLNSRYNMQMEGFL
jgi:hypothetical protein